MATHSSVLAWRIPGTAEPGGLPSIGVAGRLESGAQSGAAWRTLFHSSGGPGIPDPGVGNFWIWGEGPCEGGASRWVCASWKRGRLGPFLDAGLRSKM